MAEEAKVRDKMLLIFIGECDLEGGKPGRKYLRVTRSDYDRGEFSSPDTTEMVFSKTKGTTVGQPGNVYQYEYQHPPESGIQIYPHSQEYVGRWKDESARLGWELANRSFLNRKEAIRMEKAESTKSVLEDAIAPLREKYKNLPYSMRQGFIAAILYQITK